MRLSKTTCIAVIALTWLADPDILGAQQQSVAMVHGGNSSAATWSPMMSSLQGLGTYSPHAYDLQPATTIESQAASLNYMMENDQLPVDVVVLAHSQGGLVSRRAARMGRPVKGIVTIGTAHYGMGIGQHFGWIESYFDYGIADGLIILSNNAVWYSGMSYEELQTRQWAVDDVFWYLYAFLNGVTIALDDAIGNFNASASWDQLAFGSAFLSDLNGNWSNELARYRIGISSQLSIGSYGAGPLALIGGSPSDAEQYSSFVQSVGYDLLFRSSDIWRYMWEYGQDNPDRDFWGDFAATLAMDDLAFRLIDLGAFWVDVVGGYPHDGVVPTPSMIFPGGDNNYAIAGVSHTHETSSVASGQVMLNVLESLRNSP